MPNLAATYRNQGRWKEAVNPEEKAKEVQLRVGKQILISKRCKLLFQYVEPFAPCTQHHSNEFGMRFNTPPDIDEEGNKLPVVRAVALTSLPERLKTALLLPSTSIEVCVSVPTRSNPSSGNI